MLKIIILSRWENGDDSKEKSYSPSSSALCSGIYPHYVFYMASSIFIIAGLFVYIYDLSENLESGKACMRKLFSSATFNSSTLSLFVFAFIAAWIFLIIALIFFWKCLFLSLDSSYSCILYAIKSEMAVIHIVLTFV